jgi:hypothetical protein
VSTRGAHRQSEGTDIARFSCKTESIVHEACLLDTGKAGKKNNLFNMDILLNFFLRLLLYYMYEQI